jgi:uncharacterized protein YraI
MQQNFMFVVEEASIANKSGSNVNMQAGSITHSDKIITKKKGILAITAELPMPAGINSIIFQY